MPDADAIAMARQVAKKAETLDDLRKAIESFDGCNLKLTARHTVFEGGTRGAAMMMISDAPGRDDDASGEALTGPEGLLFDRMLASIGLSRADCYIVPLIPWRPPGNRTPTAEEMDLLLPWLQRPWLLLR